MNNKKIFSLLLLTLTVVGCSYFSSNKNPPTNRDTICNDLKTQMLFSQTTPDGLYNGQNQLDPAKQAELMNTYKKYNCDNVTN
jgi:hypothetical protein